MITTIWLTQQPISAVFVAAEEAVWQLTLTFLDGEEPLDLTDYGAEVAIAATTRDEPLLVLSTEAVPATASINVGTGTLTAGEDACSLAAGKYAIAVTLITPAGKRETYVSGSFVVEPIPHEA